MASQYNAVDEYETAPLGIKIFCVVAGIVGVYGLFVSLQLVSLGGPGVSLGLVFFGFFVAYLVVLYGLWTLEPWGWTWGMILFVIDLVIDLFSADLVGVIVSVLLIAYLWSKRSYYGKA